MQCIVKKKKPSMSIRIILITSAIGCLIVLITIQCIIVLQVKNIERIQAPWQTEEKYQDAQNNLQHYLSKKYPNEQFEILDVKFNRNFGDYVGKVRQQVTEQVFFVRMLNHENYRADNYVHGLFTDKQYRNMKDIIVGTGQLFDPYY